MADPSRLPDPEQRPLRGPMYHYTSLDASLSILQHKVLRATGIHYLNDASESELGFSIIRKSRPGRTEVVVRY
jgi:hypothetical protein